MRIKQQLRAERTARAMSGRHRLTGIDFETQAAIHSWGGDPRSVQQIDPPDHKRIPPEGAWVMISGAPIPAMEGDVNEELTFGRVFYAQRDHEADDEGFAGDGYYRVRVTVPSGAEVKLFAYEYVPLSTRLIIDLWNEGGLIFTPTDMDAAKMNEIVFYCRQRCIGLADAMVIALGTINAPVGWFDADPQVAAFVSQFQNVGGGLRSVNHERRRQAHERRKES